MMIRTVFFLLLAAWSVSSFGQSFEEPAGTQPEWQVMEKGTLVPYTGQHTRAIHFTVSPVMRDKILLISDRAGFSVFINGVLAVNNVKQLRWPMDSLWKSNKGKIFISVYEQQRIRSLKTTLESIVLATDPGNPLRAGNYFSDFLVLAALLLFAFFVVLFRMNPRLAFDYVNVIKFFSIQERDEPTVASRIGSSLNLLFFALISFFYSYLLLIVFYFAADRLSLSSAFVFKSLPVAFLNWIVLSVILFAVLLAKLAWIAGLSSLFVLRDTVRFQFFNFVRQLFISAVLMAILASFYFIFGVRSERSFYYLIVISIGLLITGIIFLFLKLMARSAFPVFHLFSYLCASEIIPLMILVKVLLF